MVRARVIQTDRFAEKKGVYFNAGMRLNDIQPFCKLDAAGEELLKPAMLNSGFPGRGYDRIGKSHGESPAVAARRESSTEHRSEAIQYRSLDGKL